MTAGFSLRQAKALVWGLSLWAAICLNVTVAAQQPPQATPLASLEPLKLSLDQIEATIGRDGLTVSALSDLRRRINPIMDAVSARLAEFEPRFAQVDTRLKQLGPVPGKDAPPEDAAITTERDQLTRLYSDLDAAVKQARLLGLRAEQLADRVIERRRALFARELFERTSSILDPLFWSDAADAIPVELRGIGNLLQSWWSFAVENGGYSRMVAAAVTLIAFAGAGLAFRRWWRRRAPPTPARETRFTKAVAGLRSLAQATALAPLAVLIIVMTLDGYGLLPPRLLSVGSGLGVAVLVAAFGRGAALGVLAPHRPDWRLAAIDDANAERLYTLFTWGGRALGTAIFLNVIHREVVAPFALTIATSALLALAIAGLLLRALLRRQGPPAAEGEVQPVQWVRALAWLAVVVVAIALATGHVGFAAFVAGRSLFALAVFGTLYLLLVLVDSLFGEVLIAHTERGRAVAATLGLRPRNLELLGTLLSAILRLLLVVFAVFFAAGPWGVGAADVVETMQNAVFGFRIGEITVSLTAILAASLVLLVGVIVTRVVQRWLETRLLPRTSLDPSLQLSVSTILGYVGVISAVALSLSELGIDLQKIALVAGALSVGIGFGLQSIVSNFVSGLILLAERPIRVGDSIVVKGEEGYVRRISVRATEIETFERASVIVPNSELITGVVKNWTHANTMGRITVKLGVSYDCDPEEVRDILLRCAAEHPQVVQTPPPRVFLLNFGDSALEFELRCVVANVDYGLTVKSDLHFAILHQFRKAGIEIPYPQREIRVREEKIASKTWLHPLTRDEAGPDAA
jgi:small-conductance mechanosensitive channel